MKNLLCVFVLLAANSQLFSQTKVEPYKLNQTDPANVVNAVFYSARTGDYSLLENICDPFGKGDGDTKRICMMTNLKKQAVQYGETTEMKKTFDEFSSNFKLASTYGQIQYEISEEGNEIAKVLFMFNHPGGESRSSEVMNLVKRDGKWYLYSF